MKLFDIWLEGFYYGGDTVKASYIGKMVGYDFRDAVLRWYSRNPSELFDPVYLKEFSRNHFSDEQEARAYCG